MEKFKHKNIKIINAIDYSWRSGGYPQRRRQCWVNGELVYDSRDDIKDISSYELSDLMEYGRKIGAYNSTYNGLDGYDMTFTFKVV